MIATMNANTPTAPKPEPSFRATLRFFIRYSRPNRDQLVNSYRRRPAKLKVEGTKIPATTPVLDRNRAQPTTSSEVASVEQIQRTRSEEHTSELQSRENL